MTTALGIFMEPVCMACVHLTIEFDGGMRSDDVNPMSMSCLAFPKGIPVSIWEGGDDHDVPIGTEVMIGGKPILFEKEDGPDAEDVLRIRAIQRRKAIEGEKAVQAALVRLHEMGHEVKKFNPYHDELGRFTSGPGGGVPAGPKRGQPHTAKRKPSSLGVTGEPNPVTGHIMSNTEFGDTMETLFRQRAGRQAGFKAMFGARLRALVGQGDRARTGPLDYRTNEFGIEVKSLNIRAKDKRVKIARRAAAAKRNEAERLGVRGGIVVQVVDFDRGAVTVYGWDKGFTNTSVKASPTSVNVQFNPMTQGIKVGEYRFTRAQWYAAQQATTRVDSAEDNWGNYDPPDTMGKSDDLAWRAELRKMREEANALPRPDAVQRLMKDRETPMTDEHEVIEPGDTVIELVEQEGNWVPHIYEAE